MISATTHFTEAETRIALRNHLRRRRLRRWLFPITGALYACWSVNRLMEGGPNKLLYILFIALGVYLILRSRIAVWRVGLSVRKNPQRNKEIRWTFTDEGVSTETEGSNSFARWDNFHESVSTPDGHLLYPQKGLFYWLPKNAFADPLDEIEFHDLLRAKTRHREIA